MSCLLTQGFLDACKDAIGGIKEILVGNALEFETGIGFDQTTGEVDTLPPATIFRYKLARASSSFTQQGEVNEQNRTSFFTQTISAVLGTLSSEKRLELQNAARANPIVFVRDSADNIWLVGREEGTTFTVTAETGTAKGDFAGYRIEIVTEEKNMAPRLQSFTSEPFDNFPNITVSPPYGTS